MKLSGHRPPLQKGIRAAIFFFCLLAAPLALHAQTNDAPPAPATNTPAVSAPVDATTNAPPSATPPVLDAPPPQQPTPNVSLASPPTGQVQAPSKDEIDDIRPPLFFFHWWVWLWIALAVILTIILLVFAFIWMKPEGQLSAENAYDLTLQKLEKTRALLQEEDPQPYAIAVSEVIRSYLGQRFLSPSTRRTTEEFLQIMEDDKETPLAGHRDLLRTFLESCDLVKFARYQPTLNELEEVHQRAFNFVTATKPIPAQLNGSRP